ncbi:hypothetical protein D3C81_1992590 [compost metagenome]
MAITTANAHILIDDHKTVFTLVHRATRTYLGTRRVFTMVTRNGQVIGKDVLVPNAVVFLPVATGIFVNTAEADIRG